MGSEVQGSFDGDGVVHADEDDVVIVLDVLSFSGIGGFAFASSDISSKTTTVEEMETSCFNSTCSCVLKDQNQNQFVNIH